MSSGESFRRRELQCHQSVSAVNDRSSYVARRLSELDVLSAIGLVVNAAQGRGVARFTQYKATRTTWLSAIDRALLERHLSRVLRFSPSLEDACEHFCSDAPRVIGEGLDGYNALAHYAVLALVDQGIRDDVEIEIRPERLARLLYRARQKALPMLVAWLLTEDPAPFQQLMLNYSSQLKTLKALRVSVRQELAATRGFVTEFLSELVKKHESDDGVMATHIPETFICDGGGTVFGGGETVQSFKNELEELRVSYSKSHGSDSSPRSAIHNLLDPSLRCRVYNDDKEQKYQWLPTEFHVGRDGVVSILSPLHGSIHPHQFPGLYAVIPSIIGRLLPLFERVLGSIATQAPPSPYQVGLGSSHQPQHTTATSNKENLTGFSLRDRQLQVVVKLSTTNLDQANPVFTGEQDHADNSNRGWQLEGDDHENIVAVGYHVLRSRNITPPRLAFRAFTHSPVESELTSQEDAFAAFGERTSAFYRGRYGRQFLQLWGSLVLHEGRSIVTPSFLAHRFEPFELLDATNPEGGELTLVTFYLVDPAREPIVSTLTVRPDQWQPSRRFVQANVDMLHCSSVHPFLPDEVSTLIADFAASHVSEGQAQLTRQLLLMQRRKLQELRFMTPSLRLEEMILHLDE